VHPWAGHGGLLPPLLIFIVIWVNISGRMDGATGTALTIIEQRGIPSIKITDLQQKLPGG